MIASPIGLGHYRHLVACMLEHAANDSGTKGWVIDICITREEDDIHFVPTAELKLFFCGR